MARASTKNSKKCFVRKGLDESSKDYVRKSVCQALPASYELEGKTYCVLHYPSVDKIEDLHKEVQRRLHSEDYNFGYCYFPSDIDFFGAKFEKPFSFMHAIFTGRVRFGGTFKEELDFRWALFDEKSQLIFQYSGLKGGLDLRCAIISGHFRFEGGELMKSEYGELIDVLQLVFEGDKSWLDLQNVVIEKPERVLFHMVRLQPNWFVNVDCKKFVFTDCRWMTWDGKKLDTLDEVDGVFMKNGILFPTSPYTLLTNTCLQLAENYESNKDYEKSSLFWKMANESRRFEEYRGYKIWSLHWWYWLSSFYGESWQRAILWLLVLIAIFAISYMSPLSHFVNSNKQPIAIQQNADEVERQMTQLAKEANEYRLLGQVEAFFYSLRVGTLQRPEPQPENNFAKGLIAVETIFVPLQAALLALAIRRKFMR